MGEGKPGEPGGVLDSIAALTLSEKDGIKEGKSCGSVLDYSAVPRGGLAKFLRVLSQWCSSEKSPSPSNQPVLLFLVCSVFGQECSWEHDSGTTEVRIFMLHAVSGLSSSFSMSTIVADD